MSKFTSKDKSQLSGFNMNIKPTGQSKTMQTTFALDEMKQTIELEKLKPSRFLEAWKKGIRLAGEDYFHIKVPLWDATDKNQLKPNYELISQSLMAISTGQAHFLALMYSFYNSDDGQKMLEALGRPNIADAAAALPDNYLAIVSELLLNYCGW